MIDLQDKIDLASKTIDKCRWFIVGYFGQDMYDFILQLIKDKNGEKLLTVLNDIWFYLPDSRFNVRVMPEGWKEFLAIIEF